MPATENGNMPFFSPDGQWVGFVANGALLKVALAGGPAQTLTDLPALTRGADWGEDDTIVLGLNSDGGALVQVPAAGGDLTTLFTPEDQRRAWYPQVLSGADAVLFTLSDAAPDRGELHLLLSETGEHRTLVPNATAGRVLDTGHLVFVRSGALWAVPFDSDRLDILGNPAPVVEGIRVESGGAVQYALAADGTLVYIPGQVLTGAARDLVWVDRNGGEQPLATPSANYYVLMYCPRVLGQWFDGIRFYAAASSPTRSRRTWAGLR